MRRRMLVITGIIMSLLSLSATGSQAEQPGAYADQPELSGEFLEFLGEIHLPDIADIDLQHFDELYQVLKSRIKDVIDSVNQQIPDKDKAKKGNDHGTTEKN